MRLWRLALCSITALAIYVAASATTTVSAATRGDDDDDGRYLALGDSVPFGYIAQAGFEYGNADNFVGYPDYVGHALQLDPAEGSCPGETTASFLSATAPDTGCRAYRANAPLHSTYASTQMRFATAFLRAHRKTRLVTITLGANDLFLVEAACSGDLSCVAAQLTAALANIGANMNTILSRLRATGFDRTIVVANYYSLDYTDVQRTLITQALNQTLAAAAAAHHAEVADTFSAFLAAVSNPFAAGSPCRAGLVNALSGNQFQCDIHPSQSGHKLIAAIVDRVARRGRHDSN